MNESFIIKIRQYQLTLVVLGVGLISNTDVTVLIISLTASLVFDSFLVSKSDEKKLYSSIYDLDTIIPSSLKQSDAALLNIFASLIGAAVPIVVCSLGVKAETQQAAGMSALILSGSIASYCGFRSVRRATSTSDILVATRIVASHFFLFKKDNSILLQTISMSMRFSIGTLATSLFAYVAMNLNMDVEMYVILIVLTLSIFSQIGFCLLSQAIFVARWYGVRTR